MASIKRWEVTAKAGQTDKYYSIRIHKPFGWTASYQLYVNNVLLSNDLPLRNYSPFYRIRGQFGWEQDKNYFLIVRDSLFFGTFSRKYRLFVNNFESENGLEFPEYWKHRGWQHVFIGVGMVTLCVGLSLIVSHVGKTFLLYVDVILAVLAIFFLVFGVFLIISKHERPHEVYMVKESEVNEGFECDQISSGIDVRESGATSTC